MHQINFVAIIVVKNSDMINNMLYFLKYGFISTLAKQSITHEKGSDTLLVLVLLLDTKECV